VTDGICVSIAAQFNSMSEDQLQGTIGCIDLDTIETIHLERSLIYAQDRLVGQRCVSTKHLMLLAESTKNMRSALLDMRWNDVHAHVQLCEERYLQCNDMDSGDSSARSADENDLHVHRKEVQLVKSELRHREIVLVLSDALQTGGPSGDVGFLDVGMIDLNQLDDALVVARKLIEEEISSIGGDDVDRFQNLEENSALYDAREGVIMSTLVARLVHLASSMRRLRASMKSKLFDVAETVATEIEHDDSILTIDAMNEIDATLLRPPSLPSSSSPMSSLLSVLEVQSCRLELNDMNMCAAMIKALNEGKVGTPKTSSHHHSAEGDEIGTKFMHGEGALAASLTVCEALGGCQSARASTLRSSVEHVLNLRKCLYESKWDDFRHTLRYDLTTSKSTGNNAATPVYAAEAGKRFFFVGGGGAGGGVVCVCDSPTCAVSFVTHTTCACIICGSPYLCLYHL
jgi:hypothetical protein